MHGSSQPTAYQFTTIPASLNAHDTYSGARFRFLTSAFLFLFLGLSFIANGSEIDMPAGLSEIIHTRAAGIEVATKPLDELVIKYRQALADYQKEAQEAGDLHGVLAARKLF